MPVSPRRIADQRHDQPRLVAESVESRTPRTSTPRKSDPMGENFNYAKEFKSLDYDALKKDLPR